MELTDSVSKLKGIGEKTQKTLSKLGIDTIENLLEHYPNNYDVYEPICPISQIEEGKVVAIEASLVCLLKGKKVRNLQILNCHVKDYSGEISLTWFNMPYLRNQLKMGIKYIFRGKVIRKNGILVIEQPKILSKEEFVNLLKKLQPIYGLTAGITNHMITKFIDLALKNVEFSKDFLPLELRKKYHLIERKKAFREIHFPTNRETMLLARRRIVFEEFFLFAMALNELKRNGNTRKNHFPMKLSKWAEQLIAELPYELTKEQQKVWKEIRMDMEGEKSMNRLIQGDVGSGKTILAILALLTVAENGCQGAMMVPTEVLAKQHYESMRELLERFGVQSILLVGSMTAKEKRIAYEKIASGEVDLVIGTHALIQEKVIYKKLALVITDEQHRFGVRQRELLSEKSDTPHILVMSATPIPRTLAIILYGDLELSTIRELPQNRIPIKNCVVDTGYRPTAYHFIEKEIAKGRQAYIICPMVEENETLELENVIEYTERLRELMAPSIMIDYLHGKMKPKEKNEIMERFAMGEIDILVSTTVIEVGINVPNATVMMIENSERFGLAQLHQLRGRVGRGGHQSYCIFVYGKQSKETKERLEIMGHSNDGFLIAKKDLQLRGPGDLFGIRQSGLLEFKMGDVFQDASILKEAYEASKEFSWEQVNLMCKKYEGLREKLDAYCSIDCNL